MNLSDFPVHSRRTGQRGVVLLFTLIVLVILLAGGVAVMRSMNTSLFSAGNIALKRDLINQGEQAIAQAMSVFASKGALVTAAARNTDLKAANYKATTFALEDVNAFGVPLALLDDTKFNAVATNANDIVNTDAKVTIRYVIDRLCNGTSMSKTGCIFPPSSADVRGGSSQEMATRIPPPPSLLYRLSMRVSGPRNTQVFLQTTFAAPD